MIQIRQHNADSCFQSAETVRSLAEFHVLFFRGMGGVVCDDHINGPIQQGGPHGVHVILTPQGRRNTGSRTVPQAGFIRQGQMMHGDFCRYRISFGLGLTDDIRCAFAGHVGNVDMGSGVTGYQHIPCYRDVFRYGRHAGHTDLCGNRAFVHVTVRVQFTFNAVGNQGRVKACHIFGRVHQEAAAVYVMTVVGKSHRAFFQHIAHFRQFLAFFVLTDGTDDFHVHIAFLRGPFFDTADHNGSGNSRFRVGHAGDGGDAAGRCRHGTGADAFLGFQARLPQMGMHVDEAGSYYFARSVIRLIGFVRYVLCNFCDFPVCYQHVADFIQFLRRVYHPSVFN